MMQRLLTLVLLALAGSLTAQDVIWEEDFSRGFAGWTANPLICGSNAGASYGNLSGTEFGIWDITSGTADGVPIDYAALGASAQWTFISDTEYQFIFEAGAQYATVYGTYSFSGDTLVSAVDPATALSGALAFSEATAGGTVEWATVDNLDAGVVDLVAAHIGTDEPTVVLTDGGNTLTYTQITGGVEYVFTYTKTNECGTLWAWSPNGNLGSGAFGFEAPGAVFVDSDTRTNGTMVMRNIFYMFAGSSANIPSPNPPPYPHYASELISPPIDISGADRALSVSISQFLAYLNTPTEAPDGILTSCAVSTDDGNTWSPAFDFNPDFPNNTFRSNRQTVPIPNAYIDGADEIRIKITFATDYYFWGIDDVSIQERIGYDMQANINFFAIPDNVNTPWSQLQPQYFMSDVQNNGGLTATNVELDLVITKDDTGEEVYNMTKEYGDLDPDVLAENDFFDTTMPLDLDPTPASLGTYSGQYVISHDSLDNNPANDTLSFAFEVTDTLFAKETGRTRGIFLTQDRSWFIGNSYYIPNGETWYARYVSFMVDNASDVVAGGGLDRVSVLLYESDGDTNEDGRIGPDEYNNAPYAFNDYQYDGTEDELLITIPVSVDEEGVVLTSGKYYFAVVQYAGTEEADALAISASEDYNYNANNFITDSVGVAQYSDVVDLVGESPNFFSGGFSGTSVPVVRLHIGDNNDLSMPPITDDNSVTELPGNYGMDVFPNPAIDNFNLDLDFPEAQDVLIRFYDKTGRILIQQEFDGVQQARYNYDVSTLPSGVYFIQLDGQAGSRIEKVVVQH